MQEVKSTNKEQVHVHISPDAPIDGAIVWTVTNDGDATVVETGTDPVTGAVIDNLNPMFRSGDKAMETKITATADGDTSANVATITQEFSYVVSHANATSLGVTLDAAQPKV